MTTQKEARDIASKARAELEKIYGNRLRGVRLFGSFARGSATAESDVDLAIILDEVPDFLVEIERTGELFSTLGLEAGRSVSRVFIGEPDFRAGRYALHRRIQQEGLPV